MLTTHRHQATQIAHPQLACARMQQALDLAQTQITRAQPERSNALSTAAESVETPLDTDAAAQQPKQHAWRRRRSAGALCNGEGTPARWAWSVWPDHRVHSQTLAAHSAILTAAGSTLCTVLLCAA